MINKRLFNIRIQLAECTITVLDNFFDYIKFFNEQNPDIILEIFLWYDANMLESQSKKTLIKTCQENNVTLHDHVIVGTKTLVDISTKEHDYVCKFKMYYNDDDTFIHSLFLLFATVKTVFNKEITKNENRNNRFKAVCEKNKDKRTALDDQSEK